ncbi:hypothetical protein OHB26_02295 [Nocardia sp. NBC_01503]|uniref:hypothetical protein n=1 Tax=Nocardia sp. NBC_01503 TaxID=2975997 RepID=UPI002E7AF6CE|nr:hypothetical protein [Nocardia sp. NBC_01503]WTL33108.1 hypothetical protein OHB26_02295 [Nocardia sp. NBC_01503]
MTANRMDLDDDGSKRAAAFDRLLEMGQRGDFDSAATAHAARKAAWRQSQQLLPRRDH